MTLSKLPKATLAKLHKLGLHTADDLALHLPLRYDDETALQPLAALTPGASAQVEAEVIYCEVLFRPRRTLVAQLADGGGILYLRFLNFYPSQIKQLEVGKRIRALGEVRQGYFGLEMVHPKCRSVGEDTPLNTTLTPVYPLVAGLPNRTLSKLIRDALAQLELTDSLPTELRQRLTLPDFAASLHILHHPPADVAEVDLQARRHPAWRRLIFDELLAQQLSMRSHYRKRQARSAPALPPDSGLEQALLARLPFALTPAQRHAYGEISRDLARPHPMQRLLQGDVGSGKTVVAALAALQAFASGRQVALMSPTEILAEQHYLKLSEWLTPLGIVPVWLSGSLKRDEKLAACARIANGQTPLAIGTHALFQEAVEFADLGLVIVDEQHKFGVKQRLALHGKGRGEPHQLMMSATPIPRTLAMSFYADLDVSVIGELPPGRSPVATRLVNESRRDEVLERVRLACASGQQAYWVCPLIEESEALQLQTAEDTYALLATALPDLRVGLVHGRMKSADKALVMAEFKAGAIQLLVATTVIEVGVDVPQASLMVIEHAERMGLAQLHQLRGRVGRGAAQSSCILLFQPPLSELAKARLKIIYEHSDGFEVARQDLLLRGPGELLGARQSGVPMLRYADLERDADLLDAARSAADELLAHHPEAAQMHLQRWLGSRHDYLHV